MKGVIVREIRALIFRPVAPSVTVSSTETAPKQNTKIKFDDPEEKPASTKKGSKDKQAKVNTMERWNSHAWYYASVTLNQVVLTPNDSGREVARTLIEAYFEMFQEILGSTGKSSGTSQDYGEEPPDDGIDIFLGREGLEDLGEILPSNSLDIREEKEERIGVCTLLMIDGGSSFAFLRESQHAHMQR